jgi:hypothetical protein
MARYSRLYHKNFQLQEQYVEDQLSKATLPMVRLKQLNKRFGSLWQEMIAEKATHQTTALMVRHSRLMTGMVHSSPGRCVYG